jgi:PTS system mannose-specific IID component
VIPFSAGLLLRCFLRSYCSTACYNPRGLQSVGFIYAIEPALAALYGPGEELKAARWRYVRHFNSHPFWMPLLLGVFLRVEADIAQKRVQPALLDNVKDATSNTLSAIGDSLFRGSAMITWALAAGCLVLYGSPVAAMFLTLGLFFLVHLLRFACFITGLRMGLACLRLVGRFQLINWAGRIKYLNAFLLALLLCLALRETATGRLLWFLAVPVYLAVAGVLVGRLHIPRNIIVFLLLVLVFILHFVLG